MDFKHGVNYEKEQSRNHGGKSVLEIIVGNDNTEIPVFKRAPDHVHIEEKQKKVDVTPGEITEYFTEELELMKKLLKLTSSKRAMEFMDKSNHASVYETSV